MKQQWNLDSLYQGFNAPQFIADSAAILRLSRELRRCVGLPDPARLQETIWTWLEKLEAFEGLYQKLFSYTSFRHQRRGGLPQLEPLSGDRQYHR